MQSFLKKYVPSYLLILLLGFLFALSYNLFVTPNHFAPSGIGGIAVMVQYKLGFSVGYLSLLVNIPLCLFAFFCIDRRFACKTFAFSLSYSLFYLLLQSLDTTRFQYITGGVDTIYAVMIAGIFSGLCYGVLFKMNGSTGGIDVFSKYISIIRPQWNFFWVTFCINACIAVASYFVYAERVDGALIYNYKPVCLCLFYSFISSFIGSRIISGAKEALHYTVITDTPDELEAEIIAKLHHTVTRVAGNGGFSHKEKTVLICLINKHQMIDFEQILKKYPGTFSYLETVNHTIGKFRQVKGTDFPQNEENL